MAPATRDFAKRPKAKVGKRAPAKLNATDTSFKTASVAVRSQEQSLNKNNKNVAGKDAAASSASSAAARMELASSRGNALSTLQASLRHHAPAVRASGLKGIRDAVQSLSSLEDTLGTSILEANLPSLLPNMCRCWLDEDDDVRSLAINLFGDILKNLSVSSEQADLKCMAPFIPFLCAYASSALNSLDRSIRKDGALIVGMLSSSDPHPSFSSLMSSSDKDSGGISVMSIEMGKHVDLFIPSLERLLSSMSFGGRGRNSAGSKEGSSTKKRKRDGKNVAQPAAAGTSARDSTLLSLALLLQASLLSEGNIKGSNMTNNDIIGRRLDPSLYVSGGECTFLRGGSARANSLLLFREGSGNPNRLIPIQSLSDLPSMPTDELVDGIGASFTDKEPITGQSTSIQNDTSTLEKVQSMASLLETLRTKSVEITHSGRKNDKAGITMSTTDLETIDVLVETIRFVHRHCQSYQKLVDRDQLLLNQTALNSANKKRQKKGGKKSASEKQTMGECIIAYQTTVAKTLSLLLEAFPICPMDNVSASRYELTNAGICSALAELGGEKVVVSENTSKVSSSSSQWIEPVFSYILPRLNMMNSVGEDGAEKGNNGAEGMATNMLLKVVSHLLLPHRLCQDDHSGDLQQNYLLGNPLKRYELLEAFAGAFFPRLAFPAAFEKKDQKKSQVYVSAGSVASEQQVRQLASTSMGKTAAELLRTLISQSADSILSQPTDDQLHEKNTLLLLQMSSVLPLYLILWEERLPVDTGLVLTSLISIVRQWSPSLEQDDSATPIERALGDLCLGIRCSLEVLFATKKKKPSIFERLPEQVQKLCVGIIGLLKCPSGPLSTSLSSICSKSFAYQRSSNDSQEVVVVSDGMANYIMEVMHSLRKSMTMQIYIGFLLGSCGLMQTKSSSLLQMKGGAHDEETGRDPFSEAVFSYDRSIGQLSRFLTTSCDQASTKVLPMIRPILQKWLTAPSPSDEINVGHLVQARAAISILAAFTWDEVLSNNTAESKSSSTAPAFLKLDEKFDQLLVNRIIDQFDLSARLWSMGERGFTDDPTVQQEYLACLLGPITLLLRYRHNMFRQFLEGISRRVVEQIEVEQETDSNTMEKDGTKALEKINVVEVKMKALLLVLKSKEPISIIDLVRGSCDLQNALLSAADIIEKSVSGGHLAHLGSKLVHQAKLCSNQ